MIPGRAAMAAVRAAAALLIAYLGGNVVFGLFASGTWLFDALSLILTPAALQAIAVVLLWTVRAAILLALLFGWVLDTGTTSTHR